MPSYDFQCSECGYHFTLSIKISDLSTAKCQGCGSTRVQQEYLTPRSISTGMQSNLLNVANAEPSPSNDQNFRPGIWNYTSVGAHIGLKAENTHVIGDNLNIIGAKIPMEVNNSIIEMPHINIRK